METNNQIQFYEKFEFDDSMSLDEQLQRSTQVPFETNDLTYHSPNNSLIEYPPSFFNNNISCEADFLPWSECSLLYEECFSTPLSQICPTTTTTINSNAVPCTVVVDPIPNYPTSIEQNELDNSNFLSSFLNDPNNHIDYFINAPLNTVGVDEINKCSIQGNTQGDDYNMVSKEVKHNNNNNNKTPKFNSIHYEDIRKCFDLPVTRAAKELNVSRSVLRRKCRSLRIKRWPYRKIKSLESLAAKVKEMGMMEVVQALEENKEKLLYLPGLELSEETQRLRQVCFKTDHKKKKAALTIRTP